MVASGRVGTTSRQCCIEFAVGRTQVGARFIVHSFAEGAAKPRPYPRDRIRFGWRVAASGGGWRVDTISGPGSRPSGAWCGYSGSGAGPGPDTRKIGVIKSSRGDRKPDDWLGIYFQVTGDGHRGIGHSGVGSSAIGYRYRESADEILPSPPAVSNGRDAVAPLPRCIFPTANRQPLIPRPCDSVARLSVRPTSVRLRSRPDNPCQRR